ncbi:hypothetical protein UlMin_019551, partial [Ulmus minor]
SGFVSQDLYMHGFFSAWIKFPADYTAGVVVFFFLICQMETCSRRSRMKSILRDYF